MNIPEGAYIVSDPHSERSTVFTRKVSPDERRIDLTPELAEQLYDDHMDADPPARYEDPETIRGYTEDMLSGVWDSEDDNRAICIVGPKGYVGQYKGVHYPPGTIIDGWHRINAVIDSGVTIRVVLEYW